jgi:hypothetical protein
MPAALRFISVSQDDPLASPLLAELAVEYADRYGVIKERVSAWLREYPAEEFAAPGGALLIGVLDGRTVTGGAFRRNRRTQADLDPQPVPAARSREGAAGGAGGRDRGPRLPARLPDDR